jgi:hypothetical protein
VEDAHRRHRLSYIILIWSAGGAAARASGAYWERGGRFVFARALPSHCFAKLGSRRPKMQCIFPARIFPAIINYHRACFRCR